MPDSTLVSRYRRRATALIHIMADGDTRCMMEALGCLHDQITQALDIDDEESSAEERVHEVICVCLRRYLGMREHEISHILTHEISPCDS